MRMMRRTGQDILHDSARSFSGALILFLDNVDLKPGFYVFSVLAVHLSSLLRITDKIDRTFQDSTQLTKS
jgi:hypothetical protein